MRANVYFHILSAVFPISTLFRTAAGRTQPNISFLFQINTSISFCLFHATLEQIQLEMASFLNRGNRFSFLARDVVGERDGMHTNERRR